MINIRKTRLTPNIRLVLMMEEYWTYVPGMIENHEIYFKNLLPVLENKCRTYKFKLYGKELESRRISCIFTREEIQSNRDSYEEVPEFPLEEAPQELLKIWKLVETNFQVEIDYVLCHIYRTGIVIDKKTGEKHDYDDKIDFHADKESLDADIVSVSLGASRRFLFRPVGWKKGHSHEYWLKSGDVVHMHGPRNGKVSCQHMYKHGVPKMTMKDLIKYASEKGFKLPVGRKTTENIKHVFLNNSHEILRINLTFRRFDSHDLVYEVVTE